MEIYRGNTLLAMIILKPAENRCSDAETILTLTKWCEETTEALLAGYDEQSQAYTKLSDLHNSLQQQMSISEEDLTSHGEE
jgi:hypothetical protein